METVEAHISTYLRLLFQPGDVFEVRAPGCLERSGTDYRSTCSGYYTFEAIDQAARDIATLDATGRAPGNYVTLNPVSPALLARAMNRLQSKARDTSKDNDIICRRWLLIDVDPRRPAGISATDGELALATAKLQAIVEYLTRRGWPEPAVVMSGNGGHLLLRADLPVNDEGLIARVLVALAERFDDAGATVDRAVHNAARIVKIAGTMARKGDDLRGVPGVEDRPHRRSALVSNPFGTGTAMTPVPKALLEAEAALAKVTMTITSSKGSNGNGVGSRALDHNPDAVERYLRDHGVPVKGQRRKEKSTLILLERCPINTEIVSTSDSDIAVRVDDNGTLSYCNLHSRGKQYTWSDLRRTLDANSAAGEKQVDLSAFSLRPKPVPDDASNDPPPPDPGPFPEHLFRVTGLVEEVMAYNLQTAHRPHRILALAGAISLQAVLAARKVRDERGNRTNLYIIGVVPSGYGKDHARKTNKQILFQGGLNHLEGNEDLASGAGLVAAVCQQPAILFQLDELGRILRTIGDPRKAPHLFDILSVLVRLYSCADTVFRGKAYADPNRNQIIDQPCAVVYGTTTPVHFFEALTPDSLTDGFVARLLVFESRCLPPRQKGIQRDPPTDLTKTAAWWGGFLPGGNLAAEHPDPIVVPHTRHAEAVFERLAVRVDQELLQPDEGRRALWARALEKAYRLALVFACSANRERPVVGAAAKWACDLVTYITERMQRLAWEHVANGPFDARQKKVLQLIRNAAGRMGRSELCRRTQYLTQRERDEVLGNLMETGTIQAVTEPSGGRPRVTYLLAEGK